MKDIIIKCLKTFVQAFLAVIVSSGIIDVGDKSVLKSVIVAGVASGIAALMNIDYKSIENKVDNTESESDEYV